MSKYLTTFLHIRKFNAMEEGFATVTTFLVEEKGSMRNVPIATGSSFLEPNFERSVLM